MLRASDVGVTNGQQDEITLWVFIQQCCLFRSNIRAEAQHIGLEYSESYREEETNGDPLFDDQYLENFIGFSLPWGIIFEKGWLW